MQVYSLISSISSDFHILLPGHWTCLFVCYLNSTENIQFCSHFGALNLSYTLPSLSHQVKKKKVKVQVYSLISSISSDFHILPPGHWTCSFVCYLNSTENIQFCSHFGALNLSYILPSLSYQVLIFT